MTRILAIAALLSWVGQTPAQTADHLNLWNEGAPKTAMLEFVEKVTDSSNPAYLPPEARVAVFDMDGTILIEKPMYVLFDFALGLVKEQLAANPALTNRQPYTAVAEQDMAYFHGNVYGTDGLFDILLYATDGLTDAQYAAALQAYLAEPHPRFGKPPHTLLYKPVLQLIDYLKMHDFQVYVVSGSDPEFTRQAAAERIGIPPENIIGSTVLTKWDGRQFVRQHEFVKPLNDQAGKPVNIRNQIGRIPVLAVGNSRGDLEMLNYSQNTPYSLQLLVNHDDPVREYEYGVENMKRLCEKHDWIEISMKADFKTVFE